MHITEKQLNAPISSLTVRDLINLFELANKGKLSKDKYFDEEWIGGLAELAKFMGCSKATISRMIKNGALKGTFIKSGHLYWFDRSKIRKLLESNYFANVNG